MRWINDGESQLLFSDSFSNTTSADWWQGEDEDAGATWEIQNGHYYGRLAENHSWYYVTSKTARTLADIRIVATTSPVGTASDSTWGIVLRAQGGTFYAFEIDADGYALFSVRTAGGWHDIYGWEPCSAIRFGQPNVLRVDAAGKFFSLYVNDTLFAQVTDDALSSGSVGFIVEMWDDPDGGAWFDDLEVWSLDE